MINLKSNLANQRYAIASIAILFFFFISLFFFLWVRDHIRQYIYENIDKQLLIVAQSIQLILPEDYHIRAKTPSAISLGEYQEIEKKLTALAEKSGAKYVWTDVLIDGNVYLTSCNKTEGPDTPEAEIYYFMPYRDGVSNAQMRAFESDEPVYTTFEDLWGNFRAVFVPVRNSDGSMYLACAEFTVDYVDIILEKSNLLLGIGFLVFLIGITPLCFLYIWSSSESRRLLEQRNTELQQSQENLRTTLRSIGDAVIVTDINGNIKNMNPAAERLSGWSLEEAENKYHEKVLKFVSTAENRQMASQIDDVLRLKKIITSDRNISLVTKENATVEIIESVAPIIDDRSETIIGVVLVIRDVTERNRMEKELRQKQKLESLGQLTGGIAHDFNNMLAGILGASELLTLQLGDKPSAMKQVLLIKNATERTSELIRKLLSFSRKVEVSFSQVDLHEIIHDAVAIFKSSSDKRITVTMKLEAKQQMILGDASQLQNGLLNMFINARDAMPGGGDLDIFTKDINSTRDCSFRKNRSCRCKDQPYIQIGIQDTGSGISDEIKAHIFEPFYTTKEVGKGTGLGLAAVYGMVHEHSGTIAMNSSTDEGTLFTLCLPSITCSADRKQQKETAIAGTSATILLVDDEEIVRQTCTLLLEQLGFSVISANDGADGVSKYYENIDQIDLVIMDMIMPVMNGREAFEQLIKINPKVKVIFSSGFAGNLDLKALQEKGVAAFIMKPFTQLQLSKTINEVLKD